MGFVLLGGTLRKALSYVDLRGCFISVVCENRMRTNGDVEEIVIDNAL